MSVDALANLIEQTPSDQGFCSGAAAHDMRTNILDAALDLAAMDNARSRKPRRERRDIVKERLLHRRMESGDA